jgi:RNA polymerase sigma-70 factor (ECF subfamily)
MGQIRERDASAFETLFLRYRGPVRRHILRVVREEGAAEDLLQEVFLRIWICAEQWDGRGAFKSWLFSIATNLALNHLRSVRRRRDGPLEIPSDRYDDDEFENVTPGWMADRSSLGPDEILEQTERRELLQRFLGELPEEKREILRMVHDAEMEIRDVAESLGIPEGTVKSRLHYATKLLARRWKSIDT